MTMQLRQGTVVGRPAMLLAGEVKSDEVCVMAGHKNNLEASKKG
jgi:hypothetical protein